MRHWCLSISAVFSSLQPHGLKHARLPCPSLSPRVCSNSCLLSQWCYLTISSSAAPFFSSPQSYPASRSFPVSQLFTLGGQSIAALASTSAPPVNVQDWFPLGLTGLISLLSKELCRVFSSTKHQLFSTQPSFWSNFHICSWLLEKNHSFDYIDLHQQSDDMLFRFVIAFLPRSKHLLISWLQSLSAVILVPKKITLTSNFPPSICHLVMGLDAIILLSFY